MSCPAPKKTTLPPTDRQLHVLRVVELHRRDKGFAPTARELCQLLGLGEQSTQAVAEFFRALEKKGLLEREAGKARTARATAEGLRWLGLASAQPAAPEGGAP